VSSRMVRKYVAQAMLSCMKLEARLAAGMAGEPAGTPQVAAP